MTKCRTAYQDPTVAYNTGYNDGQREEREALLYALAAFEISVLSDDFAENVRAVGKSLRHRGRLRTAVAEVAAHGTAS